MAYCKLSLSVPLHGPSTSTLSTSQCTSRSSCSNDVKQRYGYRLFPPLPRDCSIGKPKPGSTAPTKHRRTKQRQLQGRLVNMASESRPGHTSGHEPKNTSLSRPSVGAVLLQEPAAEGGIAVAGHDYVSTPPFSSDSLSTNMLPMDASRLENITTAGTAASKERLGLITNWQPATWRLRLWTKMDFMHIHAISHSAFFLSVLVIEGLNLSSIMEFGSFWTPPDWRILYPLSLFLVAGQVSGIWLALRYRQPGPVRNAFTIVATQNLLIFLCNLGGTEAYPEFARTVPIFSLPILAACCFFPVKDLVLTIIERDKLMESLRTSENTPAAILWARFLVFLMPFPLMFLLPKFLLDGSTEWAHNYNALHPGYYECMFHSTLVSVWINNAITFAGTLRDKHLISQRMTIIVLYFVGLLYITFTLWDINHFPDWLPQLFFSLFHLPAA